MRGDACRRWLFVLKMALKQHCMKQIVIGVYIASGVLSDMEKDICSMFLYVTCKAKRPF